MILSKFIHPARQPQYKYPNGRATSQSIPTVGTLRTKNMRYYTNIAPDGSTMDRVVRTEPPANLIVTPTLRKPPPPMAPGSPPPGGARLPPCKDVSCYCRRLVNGTFPNPFVVDARAYVMCSNGTTVAERNCTGTDEFFDDNISICRTPYNTSTACIASLSCFCKGRRDGIYQPYANNTNLLRVCINQKGKTFYCESGTTWDAAANKCVLKQTPAPPPPPVSICTDISCFCKGRLPGLFANPFAPDMSKLLQKTYISCQDSGAAEVKECEEGTYWWHARRSCVAPPKSADGTPYPWEQPDFKFPTEPIPLNNTPPGVPDWANSVAGRQAAQPVAPWAMPQPPPQREP